MRHTACFLIFGFAWVSMSCAQEPALDLIIRGARIIDGIGSPAYHADIGIRNGRIARIGRDLGSSRESVDASGLMAAPGFIDVHTHAEEIDELPRGENFVRMGVTTLVLGNCGSSVRDVADLWKRIQDTGISPNAATLIGHNTIRSAVMGGSFLRPPTSEELAQMKEAVERAMQAGALGISTGLIYLPGTFAKTEEIIELAQVAARHDGIYVSHMRDEGLEIFQALDELIRIAGEARIRAHISHIKLSSPPVWGKASEVLRAIDSARARGLDITQDQYVYTASSTSLSQLIPQEAREGGREQFQQRLANADQKARMVEGMKQRLEKARRPDYSYAVIAHYGKNPKLNGKNVAEAARQERGSESLEDQIELVLEIHAQGGASAVFHSMNEEDLRAYMAHPHTMFAADSGVRRFNEGVPHPRGYGNNARVLGRYVREAKLLRWEEAVRRMTSLPAAVFGIRDRGHLREGNWADIVLFDPREVLDQATFAEPHQFPRGVRHVFVNGQAVVRDEAHTGARPGQPIRRAETR